MIFNATVIKDIRSDLTAPLYLLLACLYLGLCLQALLHRTVIELRLQQQHSLFLIFRLVTRFRILNEDFLFLARIRVGVPIAQTHARLHLVHILSAGTGGAERIP